MIRPPVRAAVQARVKASIMATSSLAELIGSDVNASRPSDRCASRSSVRPIRCNLAQPSVSKVRAKQGN